MTTVLGISAYHGDASAALVVDGRLVAAVEEERFTRIKHWAGFPAESILCCLRTGGLDPREVDHFAIGRNPRANLLRKAVFVLRNRPSLRLVTDRAKNSSRVRDMVTAIADALGLDAEHVKRRVHWIEHHPTHLASAFFISPFDRAAVCAVDGFGDFVSTSWGVGRGASLHVDGRIYFPHSLGMLYLAITQYLGFQNYGDEYKVMGLAPYGAPDFVPQLRELLHLTPDGGFTLELECFRHWSTGIDMTWDDGEPRIGRVYTERLEQRLGGPARQRDEPLTARHEALAASLQAVFEEAGIHILAALQRRTRQTRLCLAGGCGMNSVMNGKIRERTSFQDVYIQPAAGDNGTALGAAFWVWNQILGRPRDFVMEHSYWGPTFSGAEIREVLQAHREDLERAQCLVTEFLDREELTRWTAERIADGRIVGWFQGRMEWGARALGNRSILADPRRPDMRDTINAKIKFREKFRPFAPSILEESLNEYFVGAVPDPFMIQVYPVRPEKRAMIPAVTHVDGSGRLQTVNRSANPAYWQLLKAFEKVAGVPVLLNTSFNENEPIVHKPEEALDCFLRTGMEVLVMENIAIEKRRGR